MDKLPAHKTKLVWEFMKQNPRVHFRDAGCVTGVYGGAFVTKLNPSGITLLYSTY
jgi:hypothetical protein